MAVRVTIETASKAEAELIAERLPVRVRAESWRGLGVLRLGAKDRQETESFIEAVSRSFTEHKLQVGPSALRRRGARLQGERQRAEPPPSG